MCLRILRDVLLNVWEEPNLAGALLERIRRGRAQGSLDSRGQDQQQYRRRQRQDGHKLKASLVRLSQNKKQNQKAEV